MVTLYPFMTFADWEQQDTPPPVFENVQTGMNVVIYFQGHEIGDAYVTLQG